MKKIAILMADHNLPKLNPNKETLITLFQDFFEHSPYTPSFFSLMDDQWPEKNTFDTYLITGSKHSVLDETPWMLKLEGFIRDKSYKKLIGICFGHQIVIKALGGVVEHGTWHIGVHPIHFTQSVYDLPFPPQLTVRFNHQDHVTKLPKDCIVHYTSAQCEYASLQFHQQILTMQYHPEFTEKYHHLLHTSKKNILSEEVYEEGLKHLKKNTNHDLILQQILYFLQK